MAEVTLSSFFCSSFIMRVNMLDSVIKPPSAYQLMCLISQRASTMHSQQAPGDKLEAVC